MARKPSRQNPSMDRGQVHVVSLTLIFKTESLIESGIHTLFKLPGQTLHINLYFHPAISTPWGHILKILKCWVYDFNTVYLIGTVQPQIVCYWIIEKYGIKGRKIFPFIISLCWFLLITKIIYRGKFKNHYLMVMFPMIIQHFINSAYTLTI